MPAMLPEVHDYQEYGPSHAIACLSDTAPFVHEQDTGIIWAPGGLSPLQVLVDERGMTEVVPSYWICCPDDGCRWMPDYSQVPIWRAAWEEAERQAESGEDDDDDGGFFMVVIL